MNHTKWTLSLWALSLSLASAEVSFKKTTLEATAQPGAKTSSIVYHFTNKGPKDLKITNVTVGCSCLKPSYEDKNLPPQKNSQITLNFTLGSIAGKLTKHATVYFSDGSSQKLTATVNLLEYVSITPRTLTWKKGAPLTAKTINFTINGNTPMHVTKVSTTSKQFTYQTKVLEKGKKYQITVTPTSTEKAQFELIRIITDSKVQRYRLNQAFATVK